MGSRTKALALVSLMLISIVPAIASAHDDPVSLNDPFSELDSDISDLLLDWQVPGAQVAVMYLSLIHI